MSGLYSRYPLKFLTPKIADHVLWAYLVNFGGGLVYKTVDDKITYQTFDVEVEDGGLFLMIPHPITCFAGARFQQRQSINVNTGGSVVFIDWLTCGRCARGECWAFHEYTSKVHVRLGGKLIINDCTKISDERGGNIYSEMYTYHTFANLFLFGERVKHISQLILKRVQSQTVTDHKKNKTIVFSASPILDGVFLRVATLNTSIAFSYLRETLKELFEELGNDPFKQ